MNPLTYRVAGVDIDAGEDAVRRIAPLARATARPEVLGGIGGFAAFVSLPSGYREPVLVSSTDGVGTKLKVAFLADRHDTVGIDLVAMGVNDLLVHGAEPLFFLDYLAVHRVEPARSGSSTTGASISRPSRRPSRSGPSRPGGVSTAASSPASSRRSSALPGWRSSSTSGLAALI